MKMADTMTEIQEAKELLLYGNNRYMKSEIGSGDISMSLRKKTSCYGQHPYAIILTCSDSRVIPEYIFSADIGDLFVIRVAGNVISDHQLGSIEYAAGHLGTKLVVVLGHTHCGAIEAAINGNTGRFTDSILRDIQNAVGNETDDLKASCLNVRSVVEKIRQERSGESSDEQSDMEVIGALYHIEDGRVEWLD